MTGNGDTDEDLRSDPAAASRNESRPSPPPHRPERRPRPRTPGLRDHTVPGKSGARTILAVTTVDVLTEIVIERPRHYVAAYVSDPGNSTQWYVNITAVQWKTPKPAMPGSRMEFIAQFLGRTLTYTYEVTELVPDERLVMRTAEGPFPMETTYAWTDSADGNTRMTLRNRGEPSGFSRIAAPIVAMAMRRANTKDLARLKAILEAS